MGFLLPACLSAFSYILPLFILVIHLSSFRSFPPSHFSTIFLPRSIYFFPPPLLPCLNSLFFFYLLLLPICSPFLLHLHASIPRIIRYPSFPSSLFLFHTPSLPFLPLTFPPFFLALLRSPFLLHPHASFARIILHLPFPSFPPLSLPLPSFFISSLPSLPPIIPPTLVSRLYHLKLLTREGKKSLNIICRVCLCDRVMCHQEKKEKERGKKGGVVPQT